MKQISHSVPRDLIRNARGVLLVAAKQLVFDLLGSAEFEAFVSCLGGTIRKSKPVYVRQLPEVYEVIAKLSTLTTGNFRVGFYTHVGLSAKMGWSIAVMNFHFIDQEWCLEYFSLCFFNMQDMEKSTAEHAVVMSTCISTSDKLDKDVTVVCGTTDNEPSLALAADKYLGYNGSMRCVCQTLALATNDAISNCEVLSHGLKRINDISSYINSHPEIATRIASEQCREYRRDRIMQLQKQCPTRWHSKLAVIEKYIVLQPVLNEVLPEESPPLLSQYEDEHLADCVLVLREVRRVARLMEFDRQITASRTLRILKELYRTLNIMAAGIASRDVLLKRERTRKSYAKDDLVLDKSRDQIVRDEYARN